MLYRHDRMDVDYSLGLKIGSGFYEIWLRPMSTKHRGSECSIWLNGANQRSVSKRIVSGRRPASAAFRRLTHSKRRPRGPEAVSRGQRQTVGVDVVHRRLPSTEGEGSSDPEAVWCLRYERPRSESHPGLQSGTVSRE